MISILVVDDHTLVRAGLCSLLEDEPDMKVVGAAAAGREAVSMCNELRPDVVVLDFDMPDIDGIEVTRQIVAMNLPSRILVLTMHAHEEYAVRLIHAGASGFIIKGTSPDELTAAIRKVASGKTYITPSIMEGMIFSRQGPGETNPIASLSDRELQVLIRLARGKIVREISEELCLSTNTVDTYRKRLFEKLKLRNISDLTRFAIRNNLIDMY